MISIPRNIQEIQSYRPGKPVAEIVAELGLDEWAVLWNNENNLGASPLVAEEIQKALSKTHLYPDPSSEKLRQLIAAKVGCQANQIVVNNGSETILDGMFRAFFETGDELLTCEGTFVAVYIWAKSNKVNLVKCPLGRGFRFDVQLLLERITDKTKVIYIANPNNPSGTIITNDELEGFLDQVPEDIIVVVDEAYFEYAQALSSNYPDSTKLNRPNVLTMRTFSKAYGIAGARVGYAIGPQPLIEALSKVKMTFAPSNLAQAAAIGAIQDEEHLGKSIALNTKALSLFYDVLHNAELNYIPSFGNFVMVDLGSIELAQKFTQDLYQKGVFVRHLPAFGLPQCVRISTGTETENRFFAKVLKENF